MRTLIRERVEVKRRLKNDVMSSIIHNKHFFTMIKSRRMKREGQAVRKAENRSREDWWGGGMLLSLSQDKDRLCGLVVRVLGYRSGGPGSIPGTTRKKSNGSGTGSTQPHEYN
jgi:hypothetical protein